ncbi:biopolymer transporter ExbD [Primorskyibacter sp. S187A]|uniref:biopolymer transporter ExbD n=1 Tax=Primorskyibacter sp. S187A TaxID=3415130 RepID=UPI003C7CEC9F
MRRISRRRRLSMTSLIDVIFLLLLFFMLTSTFTRFAEVEVVGGGSGAVAGDAAPIFAQLRRDSLRINGVEVALEALRPHLAGLAGAGASASSDAPTPLLVALGEDVTAQRLTDLLVTLQGAKDVSVTILGAS